jgi:sodium transport system ATP-binding protein
MIEARDLRKSFRKKLAVRGVSFTAADGSVTAILGPNGAGKTTSLRMLYGLLTPDSGSASVDGFAVSSRSSEAQQRLGVLPDTYGLYTRLTAREHMSYFGSLHGLEKRALHTRIEHLLQLFEMSDIADRPAQGFSQGERMKVALASALVHDPPNIILDEPTRGLDIMSTRAVRSLLLHLKKQGKCIIFSSHVMQEVTTLCDRIVIIAGGEVVANSTPEELLRDTGQSDLEEAFMDKIRARAA